MDDLEDGLNAVATIPTPDTTEVVQSARYNVNCPNAVLSTIRVSGAWDGTGEADRLDEVVYEISEQGVRR
jgi:hypothetical protein